MAPKRKASGGKGDTRTHSPRPKRAKSNPETDLQLPYDATWGGVGEQTSKGLYPLMVLTGVGIRGCQKIAGFDIDSTLIVPKSGKKFATGRPI